MFINIGITEELLELTFRQWKSHVVIGSKITENTPGTWIGMCGVRCWCIGWIARICLDPSVIPAVLNRFRCYSCPSFLSH